MAALGSAAFSDLEGLIKNAEEMVSLINRYSQKASARREKSNGDEEVEFVSILDGMGISNPVTRENIGKESLYFSELSRQLTDFIVERERIQEKGGMMQLTDVYCAFNRARGTELVTPQDLLRACELFESLHLPLRIKKFESGVLVVQHTALDPGVFCAKVQERLRQGPLSCPQIADEFNVALVVVQLQLELGEKRSMICRDASTDGLVRWYTAEPFLNYRPKRR